MSKLVCKNCKSIAVEYEDYVGGTSYYRCKTCGMRGNEGKFTQVTLFDRITASPEVLAPKFIYEATTCVGDGYILAGYRSTITAGFWLAESEAIAATVAKLKEVAK